MRTLFLLLSLSTLHAAPFSIQVVDRSNGQPVPMVELRTTHELLFVTDNHGLAAIDAPELQNQEIYLHLSSHGYELKPDGFGFRGVRVTPKPDASHRIEIDRLSIAQRIGRLTGAGRFAEGEKLGIPAPAPETGVFGCDSVLLTRHNDRLFWLWGDTTLPHYPLGVFHSTAATTPLNPLPSPKPPLAIRFELFRDQKGSPRGVSNFPGPGPTWLSGMISIPDANQKNQLVATYAKIENSLDTYQSGLCHWDETAESFRIHRTLWNKGDGPQPNLPTGHPLIWKQPGKPDTLLFGDPFPTLSMPATFEAWSDPSTWQKLTPPKEINTSEDTTITPHRGSICWHPHRKKWLTVFTQLDGKPSHLGEIWFAQADSPLGPWSKAVKILTHNNQTFYNPRIHPELIPENADYLLFEGTFTTTFADRAIPLPRYNYNQILYRLDLTDPRLPQP